MKRITPNIVDAKGNPVQWENLSEADKIELQKVLSTIGSRVPVTGIKIVQVDDKPAPSKSLTEQFDETRQRFLKRVSGEKPVVEAKPVYESNPVFHNPEPNVPVEPAPTKPEAVTLFRVYQEDFRNCARYQINATLVAISHQMNLAIKPYGVAAKFFLDTYDCPGLSYITELCFYNEVYQGPYLITESVVTQLTLAICNWIDICASNYLMSIASGDVTFPAQSVSDSFKASCPDIFGDVHSALGEIYIRAKRYLNNANTLGIPPELLKYSYMPF